MNETMFDVVKLILDQLITKKRLVRDSIYFAPYIMALIKTKTRFNGPCDEKYDFIDLSTMPKLFSAGH
jgi:hypothetical protein